MNNADNSTQKDITLFTSPSGLKYAITDQEMVEYLFETKKGDDCKYNIFLVKDRICHAYDGSKDKFVPNNQITRYQDFKQIMNYAEQTLKYEIDGVWIFFTQGLYPVGWYYSEKLNNLFRLSGITDN